MGQYNRDAFASEKKTSYVLNAAIIGAIATIVAAVIMVYGSIKQASLPIEATQTAEALHTSIAMTDQALTQGAISLPIWTFTPEHVSSIVNTEAPSETPTQIYSDAVLTMSSFFSGINNAESGADLMSAWNLETREFQCFEPAQCDFSRFQDFWLDWKVQYVLYDCSFNAVDTAQIYYPRDPSSASPPTSLFYRRYRLKNENGQLKINSSESIDYPDGYCMLVEFLP